MHPAADLWSCYIAVLHDASTGFQRLLDGIILRYGADNWGRQLCC